MIEPERPNCVAIHFRTVGREQEPVPGLVDGGEVEATDFQRPEIEAADHHPLIANGDLSAELLQLADAPATRRPVASFRTSTTSTVRVV